MTNGLEEGSSSPLGATPSPNGVNFSVFSRHATGVQLLLFDAADDTRAGRVVRLDPSTNRTYYYWHVFVPDIRPGQLERDQSGNVMPGAPVLWDIESDPVLAGSKLIAEAWDAAGLYQVGSFVGDSWKEWNGRFRDDVRSFFRGEDGSVERVADRVIGSPSLYAHKQRARAKRQLRDVSRWFHPERSRLL